MNWEIISYNKLNINFKEKWKLLLPHLFSPSLEQLLLQAMELAQVMTHANNQQNLVAVIPGHQQLLLSAIQQFLHLFLLVVINTPRELAQLKQQLQHLPEPQEWQFQLQLSSQLHIFLLEIIRNYTS